MKRLLYSSNIIIVFVLLVYVLLAGFKLSYPGIQYDEILFGNAARGGYIDDTFIVKRLFGLPVFLMEYIGALKAYIYIPIFFIFGVSSFTIRFPVILFTAVGLIYFYKFTALFFNKTIGILALLLLITHPDFIAFTRADVGPSVFTFVFRCSALYYFSLWLKTKKFINVIWIFVSVVLGWYSKMDYLWFTIGSLTASVILYRTYLIERIKKINSFLLRLIAVFCFAFIVFIFYWAVKKDFLVSFSFQTNHFIELISSGYKLLIGTSFYTMIYGQKNSVLHIASFCTQVILFFLSIFFITKFKNIYKKQISFIWIILIMIMLQMTLVIISGAPWHLFYIFPFMQILLSFSVFYLSKTKYIYVSLLLFGLLISYQLYSYGVTVHAYTNVRPKDRWSTSIYQLIDYAKKSNKKFVSTDWGTGTQLLTYDYQKNKYYNYWPRFNEQPLTDTNSRNLYETFYRNKDSIFIVYPVNNSVFPQTKTNTMEIAKKNKMKLTKIKEIKDGNRVIYELYIAE